MIFIVFFIIALFRGIFLVIMKLTQKNFLKTTNDSFFFLVLTAFFHLIFLFILPPYYNMHFEYSMLTYPTVFSFCFLLSFALLIKSFKFGPTSLGSIVQNFNMIVPIVAGLIIWNEKIFINQIIGLILFVFILYLFNSGSYKIEEEINQISLKWSIIVLGSTLFSGLAVLSSKQFTLIYINQPKEFLLIYNLIIILCGLIFYSYSKLTGRNILKFNKKIILYAAVSGLLLCSMNILFLQNVAKFDSAYFFPMLSIGGMVSIIIFSRIILKESGTYKTYIGIALSFIAIMLLSMNQ